MNVTVKHDGASITSHVISYTRESKICTGIGMLELVVDYTYGSTFNPWDEITIYEGGSKTGIYFVSSVSEGQPSATITVTAQDNSKRLSDYFISDSYLVDYPSYSRYWIELFLTEVGISYTFTTNEESSLLSNNTALGLMSAYEQILMLLQMNGWYITFDSSGKAKIGKANVDYGTSGGSFGKGDIIEIRVDKNDSMYRNRVVVWGNGDPESGRWVFADVSKPTKWDYDRRDKRTIVVSNSNIPTVKDAFILANKAIMEFAKITVEKHITLEGARNIDIGDVVKIRSGVFTGKGLVTTFGTSMSKQGLITNISMDERCPRLFGFYNLGGFVYVATFGSGVWRKHIQPSAWSGNASTMSGFASGIYDFSGWYDSSSGITDMSVTDLHVNAGVLASVTSSGQSYYAIEDNVTESGSSVIWSGVVLENMAVMYSGGVMEVDTYSGVMARACIIDRDTNYVHIVADNRSGLNYGDFLYETDPLGDVLFPSFAYDVYSGNIRIPPTWLNVDVPNRAWVLEINPYDGGFYGYRSVNVSGNFDFYAYDIENDGTHDYVEAVTFGSGIIPTSLYNGVYEGAGATQYSNYTIARPVIDHRLNTVMSYSGISAPVLQNPNTISVSTPYTDYLTDGTVSFYDYLPVGSGYMVYEDRYTAPSPDTTRLNAVEIWYDRSIWGDELNPQLTFAKYTASTADFDFYPNSSIIKKMSPYDRKFTFIGKSGFTSEVSTVTADTGSIFHVELDLANSEPGVDNSTATNTLVVGGLPNANGCIPYTLPNGSPRSPWSTPIECAYKGLITINEFVQVKCVSIENGFKVLLIRISLLDGSYSESTILEKSGTGATVDSGEYFFCRPLPALFQHGSGGFRIIVPYIESTVVTGLYGYEYVTVKVRRFKYTSPEAGTPSSGGAGSTDEEILDWSSTYGTMYAKNSAFSDHIEEGNFNNNRQYCQYVIGSDLGTFGTVADSAEVITDCFDNFTISHGETSSPLNGYAAIYTIRGNTAFSSGLATDTYQAVGKKLDGTFCYINVNNCEVLDNIVPTDPDVVLHSHLCVRDSFNGEHFFRSSITGVGGNLVTVALNFGGSVSRMSNVADPVVTDEQMFGNFRSRGIRTGAYQRDLEYVEPFPASGIFPIYQILQRTEDDFSVVKSGLYRDRLEISNYSPLVTMDRRINSAETYYISQDGSVLQTTHVAMSGYNLDSVSESGSLYSLGILADDMRYAYLDGANESGSTGKLFVVYSGGVGYTDLDTLDSFSGLYLNVASGLDISNYGIPSGYTTRIETSNYALPDQYLFVSVSGDSGMGFYQKDPSSGVWVDYSSGYPQARTTIIRLDDSI